MLNSIDFVHRRDLLRALVRLFALGVWVVAPGYSQNAAPVPLNQRVLVVYNASSFESGDVASYYMARRGIPSRNQCAISPPATETVNWNDFDSTVRTPIKNCLNAVGANNILYIVFTHLTPYALIAPNEYEYSLDQFVADIWDSYSDQVPYPYPDQPHPYYADAQTQGNVYSPFVSFADYRNQPMAATLYSVWRLDAASAGLAKGLVDKAIAAETLGLRGQGCFDRRIDVTGSFDASYDAGDWDIFQAANFARQAGFAVTEDDQEAEFGTPPAPLRCDGAAMFAGWYSLDNYNDAFTWNPGALGFHLDSASAANPRGGSNWSANAVIRGITVTSGSVNEPYLEGLAHVDGVYRNLFEGANVGDALLRNTAWLKWMIINIGDPLYRPFPGGFPAFNPITNPQNSLALAPRELIAGQPASGTVTLARPAPAGGTLVNLTSSDTAATVPGSVTVPEGARSATFPIVTNAVTVESSVLISASFGATTLINTLTASPLELDSLYLPPSGAVTGGAQAEGKVYLTGAVPSGGFTITLTSDHPAVAAVPLSVTIPAGAGHATFTITTVAVAAAVTVSISASDGRVTRTAALTVTPPGP